MRRFSLLAMLCLLWLTSPLFAGYPNLKPEWNGKPPVLKDKVIITHFAGSPLSGDTWDKEQLTKLNTEAGTFLRRFMERYKDNPNVILVGYVDGRNDKIKVWLESVGMTYPTGYGITNTTAQKEAAVSVFPTVQVYSCNGERKFSRIIDREMSFINFVEKEGFEIKEGPVKDFYDAVENSLKEIIQSKVEKEGENFKKAEKLQEQGKAIAAYNVYRDICRAIPGTEDAKTAERKMQFLAQQILLDLEAQVFKCAIEDIDKVKSTFKKSAKELEGTPLYARAELLSKQIDSIAAKKDEERLNIIKLNYVKSLQSLGQMNKAALCYDTLKAATTDEGVLGEVDIELDRILKLLAPTACYVLNLLDAGEADKAIAAKTDIMDYFKDCSVASRFDAWVSEKNAPGYVAKAEPVSTEVLASSAPSGETKTTEIKDKDDVAIPDDMPLSKLIAAGDTLCAEAETQVKLAEENTTDNDVYKPAMETAIHKYRLALKYYQRAVAISPDSDNELKEKIRNTRQRLFWAQKFNRN